jgi:hypothetical protein
MPSSARFSSPRTNAGSPFDLDDGVAYRAWRAAKLADTPTTIDDLLVPIGDIANPTEGETAALAAGCAKANMAFYRSAVNAGREAVAALGRHLGLRHLDANPSAGRDGLTAIEASGGVPGRDYIPHTDKPLNWHTDGYYNPPDRQVRAMTLHCVRAAAVGGTNVILDPELVYIRLRDQDPDHIAALSRDDAMTIPANCHLGKEVRAAQSGPVFSVDPPTGALHTRYTARSRSIEWRDDARTRAAISALEAVLSEPEPWALRYRLSPGEGIVCNNAFHRREGFRDPPAGDAGGTGRLLLRGRYYDRIAGAAGTEGNQDGRKTKNVGS